MAIITISREMGSVSQEHIKWISDSLGMVFIGKEAINERMEAKGVSSEMFRQYDEKKPGFIYTLFHGEPDYYLECLKTILYEEVREGNRVLIGRGTNFIFSDIANCLRVKIVASEETKVANLCEWEGFSEATARELIKRSDKERAGYCLFHFNRDWYAHHEYDLVMNTSRLSLNKMLSTLKATLEIYSTPEREAHGLKVLRDRALARQVGEAIVLKERLDIRFLEIDCDDGCVILRGLAMSPSVHNRAERIVSKLSGVRVVENNLKIITHAIPRRR